MPLEMKYFILKPRAKHKDDHWATASQDALLTYADRIEGEDEDLARELRLWAQKEIIAQEGMDNE